MRRTGNREAAREVIIPRKTVIELSKLLGDVDDAVELRIGTNQVTITLPGTELVTKVVDGKFPDYQRVIPANQPRHLKANRQSVMQALQRAAILSNEKFRGVRLVMTRTPWASSATTTEQEEGRRNRSQLQQRSARRRLQRDLSAGRPERGQYRGNHPVARRCQQQHAADQRGRSRLQICRDADAHLARDSSRTPKSATTIGCPLQGYKHYEQQARQRDAR
jgi:hypothetical protein